MKSLYFAIEKRFAQISTLISFIFISLLSPELLEYIVKQYKYEEMLSWYRNKNNNLTK